MNNETWFNEDWKKNLISYCNEYNIPVNYLVEVIGDLKVIPMIRGKAFEFSVFQKLKEILPQNDWIIEKPMLNAQSGSHDIDVKIIHGETGKIIRVECKLAKNKSYRFNGSIKQSNISIKCMRSRTLGENKAKLRAPQLGVSKKVLLIHNDQYLPQDFDILITSIGNAFYVTDRESGLYKWGPTNEGIKFLDNLKKTEYGQESMELKDFAFNQMYIAKSTDLVINKQNNVKCTRKKCINKGACGFIPNFPLIVFDNTGKPIDNWVKIEKSLPIFQSFIENSEQIKLPFQLGF